MGRSRAARGADALFVGLALGLCAPRAGLAQDWTWPERAENLRELPADFPPERLSAVMRGFTQALGVRCSYCHVGEEGQPLATYDFASDANPIKDKARAMYRLLGVVNDALTGFEPSGERVNVWCHTCHAGRPRPQTLDEAVTERWRAGGGDAAVSYFRDLRARYREAGAYDLRPSSVVALAQGILQAGDSATARTLLELNVDGEPGSWEAHEGLGDLLFVAGDPVAAAVHYRRALVLSPGNPSVAAKLERIR